MITIQNGIQNGKNYGDDKETTASIDCVGVTPDGKLRHPVTVRWYSGRSASASVVYCSVWIHENGKASNSGTGKAGGYGYCKKSAAFAEALRDAGVSIDRNVAGAGMSAVEDVLQELMQHIGYTGQTLFV